MRLHRLDYTVLVEVVLDRTWVVLEECPGLCYILLDHICHIIRLRGVGRVSGDGGNISEVLLYIVHCDVLAHLQIVWSSMRMCPIPHHLRLHIV